MKTRILLGVTYFEKYKIISLPCLVCTILVLGVQVLGVLCVSFRFQSSVRLQKISSQRRCTFPLGLLLHHLQKTHILSCVLHLNKILVLYSSYLVHFPISSTPTFFPPHQYPFSSHQNTGTPNTFHLSKSFADLSQLCKRPLENLSLSQAPVAFPGSACMWKTKLDCHDSHWNCLLLFGQKGLSGRGLASCLLS